MKNPVLALSNSVIRYIFSFINYMSCWNLRYSYLPQSQNKYRFGRFVCNRFLTFLLKTLECFSLYTFFSFLPGFLLFFFEFFFHLYILIFHCILFFFNFYLLPLFTVIIIFFIFIISFSFFLTSFNIFFFYIYSCSLSRDNIFHSNLLNIFFSLILYILLNKFFVIFS